MDNLYSKFRSLGITFKEYCHLPIPTSKEALSNLPPELADGFLKNLCLKDSSKRVFLLSTLWDTKIDIKSLSKALNANKLRFAEADYLTTHLSTIPGSLSPFSLMHDKENAVQMVFDESLKTRNEVIAHPFQCDRSVKISMTDMLKFLKDCNHEPIYVSVVAAKEKNEEEQRVDSGTLGVTAKKNDNFAEWYTQVIIRGELIEYYDISGCYILRPNGYFIWENFQNFFNKYLEKFGVDNCYFPLFVSRENLEAEQTHLQGFSPEVAWVTKSGTSDLAEPIAIRPSSETIMYSYYSKWIRSYRNLPLKLNQWNSVVRWEFKQPTPFIRSREFLWQEGHTAHATKEDALDMVHKILDVYKEYYEEVLAVPVIKGFKTEGEKFCGADMTTTLEAFIQESGRGIQAATSHYLGLNFSKIFDITFEDENLKRQHCHQTSWGFTTRSVGIMIMIHSDDKGLVLPPKVAKVQIVIVPIITNNSAAVLAAARSTFEALKDRFRCVLDDREQYTPGWKFNDWEMKGVPLRLEIGPKDVESKSVRAVLRDNGFKENIPLDGLLSSIEDRLDQMHKRLLAVAREKLEANIVKVYDFNDIIPEIISNKLVMVPWCEQEDTEEVIKKKAQELLAQESNLGGIKPLCIPFDQPDLPSGTKCFFTDKPAKRWSIWGRSY